jgi:hypothetical protein
LDLSNELGVPHTAIPFVIDKINGGRPWTIQNI